MNGLLLKYGISLNTPWQRLQTLIIQNFMNNKACSIENVLVHSSPTELAIALKLGGSILRRSENYLVSKTQKKLFRATSDFPVEGHIC